MDNLYKITKYAGNFRIKRKYYHFPKLELSCSKYSEIFQYKHAILAELVTGGYDFYLPSTLYSRSLHQYTIFSNHSFTLVVSNISKYLTYQDIFAFKKDSEWNFLSLHNFEMELELGGDITNSLELRLSELPKIPCKDNTVAFFKPEFETLYHSEYSDNNRHLAIFHADQDYLINAKEHEIPLYSSGLKITCLGTATILPGGNGRFFKATYDGEEAWYHNQYSDSHIYGSIDPMEVDEYPEIYPSKDFSGYWKKNNEGIIVGFSFLSKTSSLSFSLLLPCPVKEVKFVRKLNRTNLYDTTDMIDPAFLWKIISETDEVLFLLVSCNNYVIVSPEDFS